MADTTDVTTDAVPAATTTDAPAAPAATLSVNDLALVLQTIQIVATRGAFKAEELATVGGLYDRIAAFLRATGALPTAPAPAADAAPAATDTPVSSDAPAADAPAAQ